MLLSKPWTKIRQDPPPKQPSEINWEMAHWKSALIECRRLSGLRSADEGTLLIPLDSTYHRLQAKLSLAAINYHRCWKMVIKPNQRWVLSELFGATVTHRHRPWPSDHLKSTSLATSYQSRWSPSNVATRNAIARAPKSPLHHLANQVFLAHVRVLVCDCEELSSDLIISAIASMTSPRPGFYLVHHALLATRRTQHFQKPAYTT